MENEKILEALKDLIWINAVIATEIIRVVENTKAALGSDVPASCKDEHRQILQKVIELAEKWRKEDILREHNLKHP